jgi:glycogen operon protein
MLLGGDEFCRTQHGNNNAYCQDNETSWYDWSQLEQHQEMYRFTRGMIAFRQAHPILSQEHFYTEAEISWFSPQGDLPNWTDPKEKQFACLILEDEHNALYLMFNAGADTVEFSLPTLFPNKQWHMAADTTHEAPQDMFVAGEEPLWEDTHAYRLGSKSSAILLVRETISQGSQTTLREAK